MRKKSILIIMFVFLSVVGSLFPKDQASAWWKEKDDNGKKLQCFAIQYKYANKTKNEGKAAQDGNVSQDRLTAQLSSTKKVCAYVDGNGKVTGKIQIKDWPSKTTKIPINDSKLGMRINDAGDALILTSCSKSGYACDNGTAVTTTTIAVGDNTFKAFAQSVHAAAPESRGNEKKVALEENATKDTVKDEAGAMDYNEGKDDEKVSNIRETCANQGGAQSLGWIVCPVMELLGEASEKIYAEYVEPSLTVDPKLFSDDNQSVRMGWETFRDIANVLFVILLLIVTFSQLTGVGIDNYGIKKILPKLIVIAVLMNLSFILCVLAVDISNILGNSFQALFNGLSETLPSAESIDVDGSIISGESAEGVLASVGVLGSAVAAAGAMWSNPAIVLSLLVSALGVFISVVFLFLMLAVREAVVVILIVISPVAMVCYMLPNAKKYFDKWLKGFEALLLVYPICGLMVGGGNYVARLLLTAGFAHEGFISAFTAMIAGIVPIFFIPMVLRNSFSALGNIGTMISQAGRGTRRFATGRVRQSGAYQNAQAAGLERQTRIRGGLDADGNPTTGWRRSLGTVLSGGRRSRQRNAWNYKRMLNDRGSLEAAEGEDFMLDTQASNIRKEIESDGTIHNNQELQNRLASALLNNDRPAIKAYTDALSEKGETGRDLVAGAYDLTANRMSEQAYNTLKNSIVSGHAAEYKDNQRSLFNAGYQQTTTEYASSEDGKATLMSKAKAGTMGAMDDSEFARTFLGGAQYAEGGQINTGNVDISSLSAEQKNAVGENAFNALKNAQNMDTNRVAYLQEVLKQSGYSAPVQNVQVTNNNTINNSTAQTSNLQVSNNVASAGYASNGLNVNGAGASAGGTSISIPHERRSAPTNIGGPHGADSVSE